jgi:hypothetical protein
MSQLGDDAEQLIHEWEERKRLIEYNLEEINEFVLNLTTSDEDRQVAENQREEMASTLSAIQSDLEALQMQKLFDQLFLQEQSDERMARALDEQHLPPRAIPMPCRPTLLLTDNHYHNNGQLIDENYDSDTDEEVSETSGSIAPVRKHTLIKTVVNQVFPFLFQIL